MPDYPDQPPTQPSHAPSRGPRRRIRAALRLLRIFLESLAAAVVLAIAVSPWLASLAWPIDLIANFTAQALFLTGALVAWSLLFRRWKLLALAAVAGLAQIAALAGPRAQWVSRADPDVTRAASIRVLHYNVHPFNTHVDEPARLIDACDADLICLIEPHRELVRDIFDNGRFKDTHPYMVHRWPKKYANWQFVFSKWPIRLYPLESDGADQPPFFAAIVDHPSKPFGLVVIHPASPRRPARWSAGNDLVRAASEVVNRMRADGLDVILTADLNASATGYRGRFLARSTDLRRTKPLWRPEGTYPAGLAWPASILLDDVWTTDGFKVASWETLYGAGSDHRAVLVDLVPTPGDTQK